VTTNIHYFGACNTKYQPNKKGEWQHYDTVTNGW